MPDAPKGSGANSNDGQTNSPPAFPVGDRLAGGADSKAE